ncbi:toxin-antitoxin system HicB family antitoxin [Thiothrix fructosivorans]|uniref:Toxin-antitoxin system HicB family antitoxin n=1 Tax=Thiothrix fructosivorans TaxID=111770 RepID=A0A8B0SLQ5_9GAMM|nr:toxin-antitoxin system HicB family antitoxin [Thiothrix fructosivorans]MBO0611684.1 toxin-antitoxin system HicB family antitoxin [Thiothrix fructosivorans]QTX10657.1 toxin-antitoxin system HicB family antitoxin [Thiothrix fructosivorans]
MAVEPVRITIRIPPDLHAAITTQAGKSKNSINQQIVDSLYAGLGVEPLPPQAEDLTRVIAVTLERAGVDIDVLAALTAAMTEDPERNVLSEAELNDMVDKRLFHHGIARLREPT